MNPEDPLKEEDTVRIRGRSSGGFSVQRVEPQPLPDTVVEEVMLLHRRWSNYCAHIKQTNENLRHQVKALLEENAALRESLLRVTGR